MSIAQQLDLKPSSPDNERIVAEHEKSDAQRLIHLLSQQYELMNQLMELSAIHQDLHSKYETFEFTDRDFVLNRIAMAKDICDSMRQFCQKKSTILTKLQKPMSSTGGGELRVYSDYLPYFIRLVKEMDQFVHQIGANVQTIDWSQRSDIELEKMNQNLSIIPNLNIKFKRYVESVQQLRSETLNLDSN